MVQSGESALGIGVATQHVEELAELRVTDFFVLVGAGGEWEGRGGRVCGGGGRGRSDGWGCGRGRSGALDGLQTCVLHEHKIILYYGIKLMKYI